jgi:hypothetical protein
MLQLQLRRAMLCTAELYPISLTLVHKIKCAHFDDAMQVQGYDTMLVQPALQSVAVGATQLQQLQIRTNLSNDFPVLKVKPGVPFGRSSLERLFASLPALEFVRLHFRTADPDGLEYLSDSDGEQQPDERTQQDVFPLSLLRWVLPPRS